MIMKSRYIDNLTNFLIKEISEAIIENNGSIPIFPKKSGIYREICKEIKNSLRMSF